MLCPNCEADNRTGAKFCDQCGFPLKDQIDVPEAGEQPPARPSEVPAPTDGVSAQELSDRHFSESLDAFEGDTSEQPEAIEELKADSDLADDESIETDYELYQPVDSETTDSFDPSGAAVDRLVFAGDEELLSSVPRKEHELSGIDQHAEEFEERLISSEDELPKIRFNDGDTMQMPKIEGEEPQKSKEYLASSTKEKKGKGKIVAIALGVVAILAAVGALATYQLGIWGGKVVPDVVGMTESDARSVLVDVGFVPRAEKVKSDDTEGLVIIMDPPAYSRIEEGAEVVVHVAASRTIPDVAGKTEKEARKLLEQEGFTSIKTKKASSDKKEGTVISVKPKVGERATSSTEVTLTLAQPYTVPDVSGMLFDDAVAALDKAGFGYDVVYITTESYPEGTIIGTEPAAGSQADKGTYVVIQISQARGAHLEELASAQLAPGTNITVNGYNFTVESLDSVAYLGNNTVSYTVTARPYTVFLGETFSSSTSQSISGTVVFNDNDEVVAIS